MLAQTEEKLFGQNIQDLEHKFIMDNQDLFYPLKAYFSATSDKYAVEKFIIDALKILNEQINFLVDADDDTIKEKVIDSVNSAKEPFLKEMANITKSLASNPQEQERLVSLGSAFINRLANHICDEVLYPHLNEVYSETSTKEDKQNSSSSYTDDVIEPTAGSQPEIMSTDSIMHKKSSETFLSQPFTYNLSSENEKSSSVDLPVHSSYQTIDEISKKQEELKVEIREKQEANTRCEKQNSELQNDFDNYQRRIESLDSSKSKDLPIIENLSKKAILASHLINANNSVIENNKNIIMGKLKELGQLEKQKERFYTQEHSTHMESLPAFLQVTGCAFISTISSGAGISGAITVGFATYGAIASAATGGAAGALGSLGAVATGFAGTLLAAAGVHGAAAFFAGLGAIGGAAVATGGLIIALAVAVAVVSAVSYLAYKCYNSRHNEQSEHSMPVDRDSAAYNTSCAILPTKKQGTLGITSSTNEMKV